MWHEGSVEIGNLIHHLWDANNVKAQCTHVNTQNHLMHIKQEHTVKEN